MTSLLQKPTPFAYSPRDACTAGGFGMTFLYQQIAAGRIEARKAGKKTLIPADSLRTFLANLPKADIRTGQPKAE